MILQSVKRINWNNLTIANIKKMEKLKKKERKKERKKETGGSISNVDRVGECKKIVQQQVGF